MLAERRKQTSSNLSQSTMLPRLGEDGGKVEHPALGFLAMVLTFQEYLLHDSSFNIQ
jgi:hypothetical protein